MLYTKANINNQELSNWSPSYRWELGPFGLAVKLLFAFPFQFSDHTQSLKNFFEVSLD
jgi:hypothetical protein